MNEVEKKEEEEGVRRIIDLRVGEVSLVDRAANLRKFVVIKRLKEDDMVDVKKTEEETKKALEEEAKKAAAKAEEDKVKYPEAKTEDVSKKKKAEDEEEMDEEEADKKKAMNPAAIAGILQGLKGAPKEAISQITAWLGTKKADEDVEECKAAKKHLDGVSVAVMEDGSVHVSGQEVTKSKKFTPTRTNTLKDVATTLMKLIGEVDEETAKEILSKFKNPIDEGSTFNSAVKPTGTTKSLEEEDVIKQLKESNTAMAEKIEALEQTRMPSKSVGKEGGTDTKVEKSDNIWAGVL